MKSVLTLFAVLFVYSSSFAVVNMAIEEHNLHASFEGLDPAVQHMDMEDFVTLTPKQYRKMTGKKMGIKKALQLKAAQQVIKRSQGKASADIPKWAYILSLFFYLGWLMMGLIDDWSGNNWWINLILAIVGSTLIGSLLGVIVLGIGWLAAAIHGFIVMGEYY